MKERLSIFRKWIASHPYLTLSIIAIIVLLWYASSMKNWDMCPDCRGSGIVLNLCTECDGNGNIGYQAENDSIDENDSYPYITCDNCDGYGHVYIECPRCGGTGFVEEYE
jgi:DnaJ-class molecular chaperone